MALKLKQISAFIAFSMASIWTLAEPVLTITPSSNTVNVTQNGSGTVKWTVHNNMVSVPVKYFFFPTTLTSTGQSITYSSDTCTDTTLASSGTCSFVSTYSGSDLPLGTVFTETPVVCGYNGSFCSQPAESNILKVTVSGTTTESYAYFPVVDQNDQFGILPINTVNNQLGATLELTGVELDPYSPVAVAPTGKYIYFMKLVSNEKTGELIVASGGSTPQIVGTSGPLTLQPIQQATTPGFGLIAVSPDGQTVYVADVRNNYVYGFNVSDPNHPIAYNSIGTGSQKESSPITALAVGTGSSSTNQVYIGDNNGIDSWVVSQILRLVKKFSVWISPGRDYAANA